VRDLTAAGHTVLVEPGAGAGSGFPDGEYTGAGAELSKKNSLFDRADLIVKVKEPLPGEYGLLREGQALFTYLHLAPNRELTEALLRQNVTGLAYETLAKGGALPLLAPMSEIAGRMAPLMGAFYLQKFKGGSGVLVTGASGVRPGKIVILGAGVVGTNAARVAAGLGMETVVMNITMERLQRIDEMFLGRIKTLPLTHHTVADEVRDADIIVGAVLVPGGRTPILITREMLGTMRKGSVIADVSVDQGGCVETSRPTTHHEPVFEVDGIIHYCVANMPGAYPRTSTLALTNATLPYVRTIASLGVEKAIHDDPVIRTSLNTYKGMIMNEALAEAIGFARLK
jgi:alanine dehydrogenase